MKKHSVAVSIALAAALAFTPALAGCSGDNYSKVKFDPQDTTYVVTSQGGNAVAYGNYIYFINGTRGYDDTDGNNNVWGNVVKGGLYRAELNGSKTTVGGLNYFTPEADAKSGLEFKYTESTDYFDEPINVVNVTAIAPKTVGTASFSAGGIFIYDNYVYFASPNNLKSNTGSVQSLRTDFFMMPLSGGTPTKLYTSTENVDTSGSEYAFYKYGGAVYLTVKEDASIVSVRIDPEKQKASDPTIFNVDASSVYFPVRDEYYTGIDNNTVEDFIYFVRPVSSDINAGEQKTGTVIEAMRPDGSENFQLSMSGNTESIVAVRDGVMFYRTMDSAGKSVVAYDSLHDALTEYSPTYAAAQAKLDEQDRNMQISGRFSTIITESITELYPFRPDRGSNEVYLLGVSTSMNVYNKDGSVRCIYSGSGIPKFVQNNYLYYAGSDADYYRVPLYANMDGYQQPQTMATAATSATLGCDYAAGYFTYFAKVDEWATGYMYFYKVDGLEGVEPQFVGQRAEADIPTEEQIENVKGSSSEE